MPNMCEKSHVDATFWIKLKENGGK